MKLFFLSLVVILILSVPLQGRAGSCERAARNALAKHQVLDAKLFWMDVRGMNNSLSLLYWFETPECGASGYVCVTADQDCHVTDVFTRYRCVIPGLTRWY